MTKQQSHSRAKKLIDKLRAAAGDNSSLRPPLERLVALHLGELATLRTLLKWNQIADALDSWRQKDGTPVSSDQLRGVYSRSRQKLRRVPSTSAPPRRSPPPHQYPAPAAGETVKTPPPGNPPGINTLREQLLRTRTLRNLHDDR